MPKPYAYVDAQNHQLTIRPSLRPEHVSVEATNREWGGNFAVVSLPVAQARDLDRHLSAASSSPVDYEIPGCPADRLTVTVAEDFTVFEVTQAGHGTDGRISVRVVTLTGRLPEVRRALGDAIQAAEKQPSGEAVPAELSGRRVLTEGEYNRAWHAVEGAAGEEGADPATVLHAVLRVLGIESPPTTT
ncbi:hypothetical protein [Streptomyces griseus]|uniref:hypothetical protein n=1 Tax=Streptomyces griseus TaxID=1911 RepID=UPI0037AF8BE2